MARRLWHRIEKSLLGLKISRAYALIPGLALASALAALSIWGCNAAILANSQVPVSPVMVAILLGLLVGNSVLLPSWMIPGLRFAVKKVLRLGIIMLGIRLSILDVLKLGAIGIPVVLACVSGALFLTDYLGRRMGIPRKLATLIGVGTSICGVSAILAAAPSIGADEEEVAYAIGIITLFGLLATLIYPYLANVLFIGDVSKVGLFLGTSVHDTSQVTGAAALYSDIYASPEVLDIAIVTKLVRNVFMIGVIPLMSVYYSRLSGDARGRRMGIRRLLPVFVLGFLSVAILRSIGDLGLRGGGRAVGLWNTASWDAMIGGVKQWATSFLVVALAAVGLNTRIRTLARLGVRPFLTGLGAAVLVGVISYAAVTLLGLFVETGSLGVP